MELLNKREGNNGIIPGHEETPWPIEMRPLDFWPSEVEGRSPMAFYVHLDGSALLGPYYIGHRRRQNNRE